MKLQSEEDDPFSKNVVYATDVGDTSEISPEEYLQQREDKLASPLSNTKAIAALPQRMTSRNSEIPPEIKENRGIRGKPPVYGTKDSNAR